MNYTLHQLQVFIKVVQFQSITKASEELFMTQPAVSIQLKNFQDQFEIPLYEVVSRKFHITEFGKEIYFMAEKIMNEVYAINYKTQAFKGFLTGRLSISVVSTGKYVMPYFLSGFINDHPEIDLIMDVTNKSKVIESLEKNEIDFALVSIIPDFLKVEEEILLDNHLYLIGNKEFDNQKKEHDIELLKTLPLIYREEGSATRAVMESFFERSKMSVRKKIELTSNEAVKQAVIAGLGFSIMPLIGIKNEIESGQLQIIPMKGFPIKSEWRLIWLKSKKMSPVGNEFLNYIRKEKEHLLDNNFKWIKKYI
jgi:DNA-binding transcriptional LysR family regulator